MDKDKEIIITDKAMSRPPDRVISEAKIAINVFKGVIEQKPKKVIIKNEQYLEYEDWQTLGEFYRCSAITRDAVPIEVDGVKGAKAHADLVNIDTGVIIGGAEAYCLRDEENWKDKPWFQLASMAQTRAGSKAFRNRLAWVAVMAGYRPTPAEEMDGQRAATGQSQHWCKEHNCAFKEYRKGDNHWYAHKTADGKWCNEEMQNKAPVDTKTGEVIEGTAQEVINDKPGSPEQAAITTEDLVKLDFKNLGEFYTACLKYFKLQKSSVDKEIPEYDLSIPDQRKRAWQQIVGVYGKKES